jgi:hypothetical protein
VCIRQQREDREVAMSIRRLVATTTVMGLVAAVLAALTPDLPSMARTLAAAQRTADTSGPDALVVATAGLLAWGVWTWGALGLALTAASALPGMLGGAARVAVLVVLPAGARRSAALALGFGIGVAAPLLGTASLLVPTPAAAVPSTPPASTTDPVPDRSVAANALPVPDWPAPTAQPASPPDWPVAPHVVVRGDCLWHIASARLLAQHGRTPTDGEVVLAAQAWWQANDELIGPDPDLLLPGQVLRPPAP